MALNLYPDIKVSYKLNTAASTTVPTGMTSLTATGNAQTATFSTLTNFLDPVENPNGAWIKLTNKGSYFNFVVTSATSDFGKLLFTYASTVYYCTADTTTANAFTSTTPAATVGYKTSETPATQVVKDIYLHFTQAKLRQLTSAVLKVHCSPRLQTVTIGGCIVQDTDGKYKNNTADTSHLKVKYPSATSDTSYSTTLSKSGAYGYSANLNKVADHESGLTWVGWTTATATNTTTQPSIVSSTATYEFEPTGDVTYYGVWSRQTFRLTTTVPESITPSMSRVITVNVYERTPNGGSAATYTKRDNNTTFLNTALSTTFNDFNAQTLTPVGKTGAYKYVGFKIGSGSPTDANVTFTTSGITLASGSVTAPSVTGTSQVGIYYGATKNSQATYNDASDMSGFTTGASLATTWSSYSWSLDNTTSTISNTSATNCKVVVRCDSTATLRVSATEKITGEVVNVIIQSVSNLSATLTATNVFTY